MAAAHSRFSSKVSHQDVRVYHSFRGRSAFIGKWLPGFVAAGRQALEPPANLLLLSQPNLSSRPPVGLSRKAGIRPRVWCTLAALPVCNQHRSTGLAQPGQTWCRSAARPLRNARPPGLMFRSTPGLHPTRAHRMRRAGRLQQRWTVPGRSPEN
jgi:hypothetical protein